MKINNKKTLHINMAIMLYINITINEKFQRKFRKIEIYKMICHYGRNLVF